MNIKLLDSHLRDFLKTDASAHEIAEQLSLTSVSIEHVKKYKSDWVYDLEIMTNRPDLASIIGLAREAAAVLPQAGIPATYYPPQLATPEIHTHTQKITIINDPKLVNRICAVVMDITIKPSSLYIKDRLEASGIRSLNNVIDITNYVMRTIGHPAHVFDYDRITSHKIVIRESKKGEKITTLDGKTYSLPGGDIVADDSTGTIIDLLGIMGLENSVVTEATKRILFFLDNNETSHIRTTSMALAIRTEAAQLNEKGLDPELTYDALLYGIKLYEELADGKVVSDIVDIFPHKTTEKTIRVSEENINTLIGITIPLQKSKEILNDLGFQTKILDRELDVTVPSVRSQDVALPEDIIEEIARVYGYHNIPNELPPLQGISAYVLETDEFYWERRIKEAMKFWGFTEIYTYSMVSEDRFEGPLDEAVKIKNPLNEAWVYMRRTLVPSLLEALAENKKREKISIFEIANIYLKKPGELPEEKRRFAGVIKEPNVSLFRVKGLMEQLFIELGIRGITWKAIDSAEIEIYLGKDKLGEIEILDTQVINFELDFELLLKQVTRKKVYKPLSKYPALMEDLSIIAPSEVTTQAILTAISHQSPLITEVTLIDRYQDSRTFHLIYQDRTKNLKSEDIKPLREKIIKQLKEKFHATIKE